MFLPSFSSGARRDGANIEEAMHTTYQPRRSGDACPASVQRASGGARGHRTQAGASSVGKLRSAPSGPLNDCACPESGRGHFLFHAGTSPATRGVCAGICESFGRSVVKGYPVRGGRGGDGLASADVAERLKAPRRSFAARPTGTNAGGAGSNPAVSTVSYNGVAVPSRREAAIGENRGSRAFLHRDALGPVLTIGNDLSLLPLAAGARRCGRG